MSVKKDLPSQETTKASSNPQVDLFLRNLIPDKRAVYLHIPAVVAGELYGPNNWGDYFPEESLKKTYKSFYNAKVYRRHKNKDPRKSLGDVVLASYNPKMRRVELVIKVYRDLAPDIAEKADAGQPVGFSMGCRVPYEECSVCSQKVFKTADRCEHMKHHMNQEVEGKLCYAINRYPDFFDISETPNPADKTVWSIKKVASEEIVDDHIHELSEEELVEGFLACSDLYFTPREKLFKQASLTDLKKFAAGGLNEAMASSFINGFCFTPKEFQYIALSQENEKLAETLYKEGSSFEGLNRFLQTPTIEFYDIADELISVLEKTATTENTQDAVSDVLLNRNPLRSSEGALKTVARQISKEMANIAELGETRLTSLDVKVPKDIEKFPAALALLLRAGLLYGGYRAAAAKIPSGVIKNLLNIQPAKVLGAIGGYELAKHTMRGEKVASYYNIEKHAKWLKHGLVGLGASYGLSAEAYRRQHQGKKIPGALRFVAENPLISTIGLGLVSSRVGKLLSKTKGIQKKASENALTIDNTNSCVQYNNLCDVFSNATVVVDQELISLADEQLSSVNKLFR